jgi:hypothetical protein
MTIRAPLLFLSLCLGFGAGLSTGITFRACPQPPALSTEAGGDYFSAPLVPPMLEGAA